MDYENMPIVQQGWQCPICKRVYSPSTPMCWYCNNGEIHTTTTCTAIPKADYENRLKADMVAMLTDIKLKIEELPTLTADSEDGQGTEPTYSCWEVENLIQEHINALKETFND